VTRFVTLKLDKVVAAVLRPGDVLGGYVIERVIGRGGMGIVYEASDPELRRRVAVKVMAPDLLEDDSFRARFDREWRVAAALEHPNVVPVYRAGTDDGRMFLAMRYVEGSNLEAVLDAGGPLSPDEAAEITAQVARALDAAHAAGLVHRDVKPANVLLVGDAPHRRAYLTDFGLAVHPQGSTRMTGTGGFLGTPAYAAPEQVRGGDVDARTDVYALGGLLFHALTGRLPYTGEDALTLLHAQLHEPPPRPSRVRPGIPEAFDRVVARGMAKHPAERYPSAGDLAQAALAAAEGAPLPRTTHSVAAGAAAPMYRRSRRRAVAMAAVGIALTAGLALIGVVVAGGGGSRGGRSAKMVFHLPAPPDAVTLEGERVWTLSEAGGSMVRVDPGSRRVAGFPAAVDLGGGTFPAIAAGRGAVWVAHDVPGGGIDRVDPATGEGIVHISLPWASGLAVTSGRVWAITEPSPEAAKGHDGRLVEIDATEGRLTGRPIPLGRGPSAIAATAGAVWIARRRDDVVVRIQPRAHAIVARIKVGRGPVAIAADDDVVWVLLADERTLVRLDPATNAPAGAPVSLGKEPQAIALARDGLWVAAADDTLTRLDRKTGEVRGSPVAAGQAPLALAAAPDRSGVWVASAADATVRRID
jgi:streptogramin lyase/predicted Ser/Thr protein kinase